MASLSHELEIKSAFVELCLKLRTYCFKKYFKW